MLAMSSVCHCAAVFSSLFKQSEGAQSSCRRQHARWRGYCMEALPLFHFHGRNQLATYLHE